MPVPVLTQQDYANVLSKLSPKGRAWPADPGSVVQQTLASLAPTPYRAFEHAANLLIDAFPPTTVELLPEWQATLGLPDPCAGDSPTLAQEQAQVVARFTAGGGQSIDYFVSFAETLGYDITITQFVPSRFGRTFGLPFGGDDWAFLWEVNAPQFTVDYLTFGNSNFGQPFSSYGNTVLQCELQRLAPAHTKVVFSYS
jgi:uncharacterized protein YmfQ (DUF2313 family)